MKKPLIFAAVLVAGALMTAGIFWSRHQSKTAEPAIPTEKITVANIGEFSIFNLIAQDQGYFKKHGLDVQIDEYDSGATSIGALQEGKADFAIAADFVGVRRMFADKDLRVLAEASHHDVFRVIARKDKGIVVPVDLQGRKIGLTRKTAGEFYLGRFLTLHGLKLEDVTMIDLPPAEMITQFENGQLDAILIFDPHAYRVEEKNRNSVVSWSAQGNQQALAIVYSSRSLVERRPELVEKYLRALVEADGFVAQNKTEAKQLVADLLNYDAAYVEYIWPKFRFALELGQDLLLTMESQARWLMANGLAEPGAVPNYLGFIYFDALEAVNRPAVTIIH